MIFVVVTREYCFQSIPFSSLYASVFMCVCVCVCNVYACEVDMLLLFSIIIIHVFFLSGSLLKKLMSTICMSVLQCYLYHYFV